MKKRDQIRRKVAIWRTLTQQNLIEKLPPCAVDLLLNYDGERPLNEYFLSEEFLTTVKEKLKRFSCYEDHGISIDALYDLTSISLLPYFAQGLVGRLKQELNVAYAPCFSDGEIHSLLWERITRKIHTYDPQKGAGWEAYLQESAYRDVKGMVCRRIKKYEKMVSLDVLGGDWDHKILPSDAAKISKGIYVALRLVLSDEDERSLFEEAVYSGRSFIEIAISKGVSAGTISLRLNNIRERLVDQLEEKFADFARRMPFQRFEVFAEVFRESISREDFRKIF